MKARVEKLRVYASEIPAGCVSVTQGLVCHIAIEDVSSCKWGKYCSATLSLLHCYCITIADIWLLLLISISQLYIYEYNAYYTLHIKLAEYCIGIV